MKNWEKVVTLKGKKFLLKVETSFDAADYAKYEAMRNEIWGFPEDYLPGPRNLMCENFLHDGSALFIAAYSEQPEGKLSNDPAQFVGFSYGFVGIKDKDIAFHSLKNLWFYSQYTGVKEGFRDYGLGVALKEFQRETVADGFGIDTITCTYDPLTGVNAWRNVHHFGMDVLEYRVSTYGEYGGLLNRLDVPSDRFFMSWDLKKKVSRPVQPSDYPLLETRLVVQAEEKIVNGKSGSLKFETITASDFNKDDDVLFVQIPLDFNLMLRETDVEEKTVRRIPLEWRLGTRKVFQSLLERGYRIIDFFQTKEKPGRNFYVLQRTGMQEKKGD
jgi:predicted GNAT superfamily acetyltransferase